VVTPVTTRSLPGAAIQQWTLRAPTLRGQTLRVRGLEGSMTDALVRIEFADGTTLVQRLTGDEPSASIPMRQSGWSVAGVYFKLGVEHILFGIDHLLFVLALLIITGGAMRLVTTVTAFTVAHSITLTAATLGFVHVPQPPVEATRPKFYTDLTSAFGAKRNWAARQSPLPRSKVTHTRRAAARHWSSPLC
jgi:HupE / UreJ protein